MRIWDYVPHPIDHAGWFCALVVLGTALLAGLIGNDEAMVAIVAAGWVGWMAIGYMTGVNNAVSKEGWVGMLARLWLICSIGWTFVCALNFAGPQPTQDELWTLLMPWIGGPVIYRSARFIIGGGY